MKPADVFVSYASLDLDRVVPIAGELEAHGVTSWLRLSIVALYNPADVADAGRWMTKTRNESQLTVEEVSDPGEIARSLAQHDRHRRNSEWLAAHWATVLPKARGKFVAVAGQETFVADDPAAAWGWAERTHPEDDGAIVR